MPERRLVATCFHHVQTRVRCRAQPDHAVALGGSFHAALPGAELHLGITETSGKTQSASEEVSQFYCEWETEYTSN